MKRIITYIFALLAAVLPSTASTTAQQADSAYLKSNWSQAIRLYHQAIDNDGVSPALYYNLGNAYYRNGSIGNAVLYYEKALSLDPAMGDARKNLKFVQSQIENRPEDGSSFLGNINRGIIAWFAPNTWAWVVFVIFLGILACSALYIFTNNVRLRKTGFFGAGTLLILGAYFAVVAWHSANAATANRRAVVTVPVANMKTSPGENNTDDKNSNKIIPVPEGTVVEITDSVTIPGENVAPKWYDVKINNSTKAWVNAADVSRI